MGVLYSVFPLECELRQHLVDVGVSLPDLDTPSRNPTPAELRVVTGSLPGISASVNQTEDGELLQITLSSPDPDTGPWALLNVEDYQNETSPCSIWFEKGWPDLILEVLVRLVRDTGPLVIFADGESPLLVSPYSTVEFLLASWDRIQFLPE